jgi:hypothetical protein
LLAQLAANKLVPDRTRIHDWYEKYFDILNHVGWVTQDRTLARYVATADTFQIHDQILNVAATLLGAAPTALAVVKATMDSLESMSADSPWITLFDREAQYAHTAHFQVSLAHKDENEQLLISLMAFGLEAKTTLTQILFFKFRTTDVSLWRNSGSVTIATDVLAAIRPEVIRKISSHASEYVKQLPDLG